MFRLNDGANSPLADVSTRRARETAYSMLLTKGDPSLIGRTGARRFEREGAILARLSHPHIARLLDAGVSPGGQPYLVLELVEGERIDRHCDAQRLRIDQRIALFREVLGAVARAHRHLIIHRDIKPSNILVAADGSVKLLNFGIAKLLQAEQGAQPTDLTGDRGGALTPDYAAPEQLPRRGGDHRDRCLFARRVALPAAEL